MNPLGVWTSPKAPAITRASKSAALCVATLFLLPCAPVSSEPVFPQAEWDRREPSALGMDAGLLDELAQTLGGRGCVIKDGSIVRSWGDQAEIGDWYSSAKPVLSTMLFFAIQEGLIEGVDQPVADFGWDLIPKDRGITFRHLGAMTSGYARPEGPGEAWAYNDFAIQLYQMTLFDKVFKGDSKEIVEAPNRLGALGFQDGLRFNQKRRLHASVRDFSRIVWLWLNKGRWGDRQLLDRRFFEEYMTPQTPKNIPRTSKEEEDDTLRIGSYGGHSNQTYHGPGIYGFNWWFNDTGRLNPDNLTWPDAPPDTVMSLGFGGNCSAFIPSLGLAVVCAQGEWGKEKAGDPTSPMNRVLALAARAAGYAEPPVRVSGDLLKWHRVTLSLEGPKASETSDPNPFADYLLEVTFTHGDRAYRVPGYYAGDGNAAHTSAEAGQVWRAHFTPDREGDWTYRIAFRKGPSIAPAGDASSGDPVPGDGLQGRLRIGPSDKQPPDVRAKGALRLGGGRYLRFAETGESFLKGGADSPENLLAFADIDSTSPSHRYEPHARDWNPGDPKWKDGKGKNLIGALNYLASKGMNSVYFLTMNVRGDGKDVWPWTSSSERFRFDCGKLDQWEIVFSHMDRLGLMLHVVLQEQENDQLLDGGELGPERKLYFRELIARFSHHPALVWNLGEENTNTDAQRKAFAAFIRDLDPYDHPIVVHTFPSQIDEVYEPLLGFPLIEGPSLQLGKMERTHKETLKWVRKSRESGRPWFVCLDEIGPAKVGVKDDASDPEHDEVRRHALWGNLMAGGSGCEWLFGYDFPHNDINCEDWRSRDRMWDLTRYALEFFRHSLPFTEMEPRERVVSAGEGWCLAKGEELFAIYTPSPLECGCTLPPGTYSLEWYNPREGGPLLPGGELEGPKEVRIGTPPKHPDRDWVVLLKRK
ncbi:MAG: hypothetical protein GHCLOJNM_04450 [bacterium]|nr:hypothetical protein [bacterium]